MSKSSATEQFFAACMEGDSKTAGKLLRADPALVRAAHPKAPHGGWTPLHAAAKAGHIDIVRALLEAGADPNAREAGDHTYPLHWAVARRDLATVQALVDSGSDVRGFGDDHALDVIGWATFFHTDGGKLGEKPAVARFLVKRGARHHIFSALSLGDPKLVRAVVRDDPKALQRRMSRHEHEATSLHFAIVSKRHDLLRLLIDLGAGLEAKDGRGLTALESAILAGDQEAARILIAAGARKPKPAGKKIGERLAKAASSVTGCSPMIYVPNVAEALDWYVSMGFTEVSRFGEEFVNFGIVRLGKARLMLNMHGKKGAQTATLWFDTDRCDEIYQLLKARALAGAGPEFVEHMNDTFYSARQFGIRDLNGYVLYFIQQL